jgi:DNA-binding MarR family transcriptional regulator
MAARIAGRTAGHMPGLDIAEQKSWLNYLDSTLRMYATLNRQLTEAHQLSLFDVRVLDMLDNAPAGRARMGDVAEALASLPSRLTRQVRRLEGQGLVRREASQDDRRGVVAAITDDGRAAARQAMVTYAQGVRTHFLAQLSRSQIAAMGENCRRISAVLKRA